MEETQGDDSAQLKKNSIAHLKQENMRLKEALKITALSPTDQPCSAEICNFPHGDVSCPFARQKCRICMQDYAEGHPAYGKCIAHIETHQVAEIDIMGKKYPGVYFYANPGNGDYMNQSYINSPAL